MEKEMINDCFLIEDDEDDQEIFIMALRKVNNGINCFIATDGVEGVRSLSEISYTPKYIFVDINMPKMNGMECLEIIRKLDHLKNSRIIMYSTSSEAEIILKCKELGADDYLAKPPGLIPLVMSLTNIFKSNSDNE